MIKICVYGLWHLGSVTAACLSDLGFDVTGLDPEIKTVKNLNLGKAPLYEPGLDELIGKGIRNKSLFFTDDPKAAIEKADFVWVTFDTPVDNKDRADVDFVYDKINSIVKYLKRKSGIIISSQVPVGFSRKLETFLKNKHTERNIKIAYSPENLRLGKAINVFKNPDRIVVGIREKEDVDLFNPVFSSITNKIEWMKTESAEMTKHAINSFLAASITFANEIASICESVGADAKEVSRGLKTEERIGPKAYLNPGLSYAGGTLARDINFLINLSSQNEKKSFLLKAVAKSNQHHKGWVRQKCLENFKSIKGVKFLLLGLAYKAGTSTLRRSSSIELANWLITNGGNVKAFDPHVKKLSGVLSKRIELSDNLKESVINSDCIVIATEHPEFKEIFDDIKNILSDKLLIDPTSFIEKNISGLSDLRYISVGRG